VSQCILTLVLQIFHPRHDPISGHHFCSVLMVACFQIIDNFVDQVYEGWYDLVRDYESPGGSPCVLQTIDLDSIYHGSCKPMADFKSPFFNWIDNEIHRWIPRLRHPNFAGSMLQFWIGIPLITGSPGSDTLMRRTLMIKCCMQTFLLICM
jgi:hypothetical protein